MATAGVSRDSVRYNAVREDIVNIDKKIDRVTGRLENMNRKMDGVPRRIENIEEDFSASSSELERLQRGQQLHEMKLELLEKEMNFMRLSNDMLMDHVRKADTHRPNGNGSDTDRSGNLTDRSAEYKLNLPADMANGLTPRDVPPASPRKDVNSGRPALTSSDRRTAQAEREEMERRERLKKIYSVHDSTSINPRNWEDKPKHKKYPWYDHETLPEPGGLVFLRFDDSAYGEVKIVLRSSQQAICRHVGGYSLGVARKERIFVYEDAPGRMLNWNLSRKQPRPDVRSTENSIVVFWFTKKDAAEQFFENGHHNRFREPCWPTSNGYDAAYLPLNSAPPTNPLYKTFLVVEFLEARQYRVEDMTQFEAEVRSDMSREIPGCLPMVVSSQTGKVIFKPGAFISPYSKVYVSRFQSQRDVDRVWQLGLIQGLRHKWRMAGSINVFSFSIEDML